MTYDTELEELEASLDAPIKKSRPTISLDEIAAEVEADLGPIHSDDRKQPNMHVKKLFCWVAMELGHKPKEVGERCGIDRVSAMHHHGSMEELMLLVGAAKRIKG